MKKFIFIVGMAILAQLANAQTVKHSLTYHLYDQKSRPGQVVAKTTVQIKELPDGRTAISRQKPGAPCEDRDEFVLDAADSLETWHRVCEGVTDIKLVKTGSQLTVSGTLGGKPMEKTIDLGEKALHVYPQYSLSRFALSGRPKMKLWSLRRDRMEKLPMQAINQGVQKIVVNGREEEVIKIYYSITPKIREKHYNHNYYYRKSDGVLVKVEESNGKMEELVSEN